MSTTNIPGVGSLVSSALTSDQMDVIWQKLLLQMLGVDPAADPLAYARIRIGWPKKGQPAWKRSEDVGFVQCTETQRRYNEMHNEEYLGATDPTTIIQQTVYSRAWRAAFEFYGPNSGDHARQVKSCSYLDFVHDTLAQSNLYIIGEFATARRTPKLFAAQWWETWTFSVEMYEQVTETLTLPSMASVEVIVEDSDGIIVDQVVNFSQAAPSFSQGGFSSGQYGI